MIPPSITVRARYERGQALLPLATVLITVGLSVYAHGLSALPLTDAYARWFTAHAKPPAIESTAAHEHRWRRPASIAGDEPPDPA